MFNIIKKSYLWIGLAILGMIAGGFLFFTNMRLSIEFTGGLEMKVRSDNVESKKLKKQLGNRLDEFVFETTKKENGEKKNISKKLDEYDILLSKKEDYTNILIKTPIEDDKMVKALSNTLQDFLKTKGYVKNEKDILEVSIIGPSIGEFMKKTATKALVLGIIFMGVYILFAFSGLREMLNPVILAVITAFTLSFDIAIPAGAYGILMKLNSSLQIDTISIVAFLTIMGYSVNDTIVIFDRIRENYKASEGALKSGEKTYGEVFETSLWQTMRRSIGTSISTLIVLVAMYFLATGMLKTFSFVLMVGVLAGTYSSIFIAAPLAYIVSGRYSEEQ